MKLRSVTCTANCILFPAQALFSDSGDDDTDQISKVRREVNEVKDVMTQNIGMDCVCTGI